LIYTNGAKIQSLTLSQISLNFLDIIYK